MANKMMEKGGMMGMPGKLGSKDKKELMEHLQNHIMYPATKRTIIESCNRMEHVPSSTRKLVEQRLPEGTFKSADEVVTKLDLEK